MRLLLPLLVLCLLAMPTMAQGVFNQATVQKQLAEQKTSIEQIEIKLAADDLAQDQILELRQSLRDKRDALQGIVEIVKPAFQAAKADVADLGPAPEGENAAPEPPNIQAKREKLNSEVLATEGLIKEAEALSSKTLRLLEKVAAARRGQFISQLSMAQTSPFDTSLWSSASQAFSSQAKVWPVSFSAQETPSKAGIYGSFFVLIALLIASIFISGKHLLAFQKQKTTQPLSAVAHSLLLPIIGTALGLFIVFQTFLSQGVITESNQLFVQQSFALLGLLTVILITSNRLVKADLIRPTVGWLASLAGLIYVTDALILVSGRQMGTALELAVAQSYIVTTCFALILGTLSFLSLKKSKSEISYFLPRPLFYALCAISLLLLAGNVFGYAALGRFIFERIMLLSLLLTGALLVRALARPYLRKIENLFTPKEKNNEEENIIFFWLSLSLDILLFLIALPLLASILGTETSDIKLWASQAFFGFKVGNITISASNIGIAIVVFLALIFITRLVQNILSVKILPKTKMDASIQQSFTQVLGYFGLIIALLSGISAVGFDLTNLALIAGALSVGIGFGLQSIVSNFVSGLILLFERPIKVNDWIITNSGEGIVKKISVRATEIETFDRTSIIVPNSELISSSVKNWTHKDKIGRVVVSVGVSYDSDPHQVKALLLECAKNNKYALKDPEPNVHFREFGDNSLIFDIRFFMRNVSDKIFASTQARYDIWDAFKDADIEISFPQRDLHIRSAPGLEGLFKNEPRKPKKK